MAPQASEKCGLQSPDHQQIGCCASNGIDSERVPGTASALMIAVLSPKISAQREKSFLAPFLYLQLNRQPPNLNVNLSNYRANYRVNFGTSRPTIYCPRVALQYPFLHRGTRCSTPEQQEFRYRDRTSLYPGATPCDF